MFFLKRNHLQSAVIALIIANIIWGASPPIFKWALEDIQPFTLGFLRFAIGAALILPFAFKHLKVDKEDIAEIFLLGFLGVTVNISLFFFGLKYAPSINSTIIGSAGPIFLILFAFIFLKEKPRSKLITGSLIGLVGVFIIMLKPLFSGEASLNLLGNTFFFLGMLAGLGHTLIGRKLMEKYEPIGVTFWAFFIGAICFIPPLLNERLSSGIAFNPSFPALFGIAFGTIFASIMANFLFFWALKYMKASETGVFVYLDPVIAVIIAYPLLGEKPDALYLLGSLFVFLGIYIAEGRLHYHPLHLLKK